VRDEQTHSRRPKQALAKHKDKPRASSAGAIKAMTMDDAHSIQQEEEVGSVEVGKQANLTILEPSLYGVEPVGLNDNSIWGSMLGGRVPPAPLAPACTAAMTSEPAPLAAEDAELTRTAIHPLGRLIGMRHGR